MSDQLLKNNRLYGWDPIEQYFDLYIPVGAWRHGHPRRPLGRLPGHRNAVRPRTTTWAATRSCSPTTPTPRPASWLTFTAQRPVDGSDRHQLRRRHGPLVSGRHAEPVSSAVRWVSKDNNDAFYTCSTRSTTPFPPLRHRRPTGRATTTTTTSSPRGSTASTRRVHTKTEAYFMWERDAELGGTPSIGTAAILRRRRRHRHRDSRLVARLRRAQLHHVRHSPRTTTSRSATNSGATKPASAPASPALFQPYHRHEPQFQRGAAVSPRNRLLPQLDEPAFDIGTKHGMLMGGFDVTCGSEKWRGGWLQIATV